MSKVKNITFLSNYLLSLITFSFFKSHYEAKQAYFCLKVFILHGLQTRLRSLLRDLNWHFINPKPMSLTFSLNKDPWFEVFWLYILFVDFYLDFLFFHWLSMPHEGHTLINSAASSFFWVYNWLKLDDNLKPPTWRLYVIVIFRHGFTYSKEVWKLLPIYWWI